MVVVIGILAAIAIPKFANTKEKAYIASMVRRRSMHYPLDSRHAFA
ncbi:MAG TPA: hypothetical protein VLT79_02200 [Gemmatimonadales bacterium]|nr:hypothetical protein [Gemmatimonadales bacterium]